MSKSIESQLQAIKASQRYFLWANYFLNSLPLSNSEVQKLNSKKKTNIQKNLGIRLLPKDIQSQLKNELNKCQKVEQAEQVFVNLFHLMDPIENKKVELIIDADSHAFAEEKKEIRNYVEIELFTILISMSYSFHTELNTVRQNKTSSRIPAELWKNFSKLIDFFKDKDKSFLDFLTIFQPILEDLNMEKRNILKCNASNISFVLLRSIVGPLLGCLRTEHRLKVKQESLLLSFFTNLISQLFQKDFNRLFEYYYYELIQRFLDIEIEFCHNLTFVDQQNLVLLSRDFLYKIQHNELHFDKNNNDLWLFDIGIKFSKINALLCGNEEDPCLEFTIEFINWVILTFPHVSLEYPNDNDIPREITPYELKQELQFDAPEWFSSNDDNSKDFRRNPTSRTPIRFLTINKQIEALCNHLMDIREHYLKAKNQKIIYDQLCQSYRSITSIREQHLFISLAIILLEPVVDSNVEIPNVSLDFLFEPTVFDIPQIEPGKFLQFPTLTSGFLSLLQSFIFSFSKNLCSKPTGRLVILNSLSKQLEKESQFRNRYYFYLTNMLPFFEQIGQFDIAENGIADLLMDGIPNFQKTELFSRLFERMEIIISHNPAIYFPYQSIIDKFTSYTNNKFFTKSIYNTLLSSLKYCSKQRDLATTFEIILRTVAYCMNQIAETYKKHSQAVLTILEQFHTFVTNLKLDNFYSTHFPREIIEILISIPKKFNRDDSVLRGLTFLYNVSCISNAESSEGLSMALQQVTISEKVIDILMKIIFGQKMEFTSFGLIKNVYGIKPLVVSTQHSEYEEKVLNCLLEIITKSQPNCYQVSESNVVDCLLKAYLDKPNGTIETIIYVILTQSPSFECLNSIFKNYAFMATTNRYDKVSLEWLNTLLMNQLNEKESPHHIYISLNEPIQNIQLNGAQLSKQCTIKTSFALPHQDQRCQILEFKLSPTSSISCTFVNMVLYIQFSDKQMALNFKIEEESIVDGWVDLEISLSKHHIKVNKDKMKYDVPIFPDQFTANFGDNGLQFAYYKIYKKQKLIYEIAPKPPDQIFMTLNDKDISLIKFNGLLTVHETVIHIFKSANLFESCFNAMSSKRYYQYFFEYFTKLLHNPEIQANFYKTRAIDNLVEALMKIRDFLEPSYLESLLNSYKTMMNIEGTQLKKDYMNSIWLNPNIFFGQNYDVAVEYVNKYLMNFVENNEACFSLFFDESRNFITFFQGLFTMNYDQARNEELVDYIWVFLQQLFIQKHSYQLQFSFMKAMRDCTNKYFINTVIPFFEQKVKAFVEHNDSDISLGVVDKNKKNSLFFRIKQSSESLINVDNGKSSDYNWETPFLDNISCSLFIILLPFATFENQLKCINCLKFIQSNPDFEAKTLIKDVLNVLGKIPKEELSQEENVFMLIKEIIGLMSDFKRAEMFPLISYLTSFADQQTSREVFKMLKKLLITKPEIMELIMELDFWAYWVIILCQNARKGDDFIDLQIDFMVLFFSSGHKNSKSVYTAIHSFDIYSYMAGCDFYMIKILILQKAFDFFKLRDGEDLQECLNFISFAFSALFTHFRTIQTDQSNLKIEVFDINVLKRYSESLADPSNKKNIAFEIKYQNNKLDDQGLASLIRDKFARIAYMRPEFKLFSMNNKNDLYIPFQIALGYLLGSLIRINDPSIQLHDVRMIVEQAQSITDGSIVHKMVGIILACYGSTNTSVPTDNEDLNYLFDVYNLYTDSQDSPEWDLFAFEEYLYDHRNEIMLCSFFSENKYM